LLAFTNEQKTGSKRTPNNKQLTTALSGDCQLLPVRIAHASPGDATEVKKQSGGHKCRIANNDGNEPNKAANQLAFVELSESGKNEAKKHSYKRAPPLEASRSDDRGLLDGYVDILNRCMGLHRVLPWLLLTSLPAVKKLVAVATLDRRDGDKLSAERARSTFDVLNWG
jgi:hypothetical protein